MADDWEALLDNDAEITLEGVGIKDEVDLAFVAPEPEKVPASAPKQAPKQAPAPAKKKKNKKTQPEPSAPARPETPEERAKRIQAEAKADYDSARDLFDVDVDARVISTPNLEINLDTFKPTTEKDFEDLATFLAAKLTPHESHFYYRSFLKSLLKQATEPMTVEDLKEVNQFLTILVNDKLKARKGKPKKTTGVKKTLNTGGKALASDLAADDVYDDYDDYDDFM